jgi:FKBP-type peptidyl-prolyl cis-trans isomerase FkpA
MNVRRRIMKSTLKSGPMRLVLTSLLVVACATPALDPTEVTYAPDLGVNLSQMTLTQEGLYWQDITLGVGDGVEEGDRVIMHYLGWLVDGELFDSSVETREPVGFEVGRGQVIDGWELGLVGMREGGIRRLVIPPHLAYGSRGISGAVPGNATLVFEVRLMRLEG